MWVRLADQEGGSREVLIQWSFFLLGFSKSDSIKQIIIRKVFVRDLSWEEVIYVKAKLFFY